MIWKLKKMHPRIHVQNCVIVFVFVCRLYCMLSNAIVDASHACQITLETRATALAQNNVGSFGFGLCIE